MDAENSPPGSIARTKLPQMSSMAGDETISRAALPALNSVVFSANVCTFIVAISCGAVHSEEEAVSINRSKKIINKSKVDKQEPRGVFNQELSLVNSLLDPHDYVRTV